MYLIAEKVSVIFIYIGAGFLFNRCRLLPSESVRYFNILIMDISAPCLMISSVYGQRIAENTMHDTIVVFFAALFFFIITAVISMPAADLINRGDRPDANVLAVGMTSCNSGFMGLPIAKSVFGNTSLYYMIICNIVLNLYLFIIAIMQFNRGTSDRGSAFSAKAFLRPFTNPVSIASLASVALLFSGLSLPAYPMSIINTLGNICIPLSMIVVGIQLGESDIRHLITSIPLLLTSFVKLIIFPALCTLLIMLLPLDGIVRLTLALSTAFPTAVMTVVLAEAEKKNAKLMAEAVASTTLLSLVTLPLWIYVLSQIFL